MPSSKSISGSTSSVCFKFLISSSIIQYFLNLTVKKLQFSVQIMKARAELGMLLEQQTQLHAEINSSHESLIHRLPPEISSYIFEMTLPREWYTVEER